MNGIASRVLTKLQNKGNAIVFGPDAATDTEKMSLSHTAA